MERQRWATEHSSSAHVAAAAESWSTDICRSEARSETACYLGSTATQRGTAVSGAVRKTDNAVLTAKTL
eukprot:990397-Pleurochrysis_carterae.AAC.4